jgi:outer membrane lipoprotein-sorting protein
MDSIMSKQDKIEAAQKAKATLVTKPKETAVTDTATKTTFHQNPAVGECFWQIAGTQIYSRKKEELKSVRSQMNTNAGTPEIEFNLPTPSNTWKFRITKGPNHPNR